MNFTLKNREENGLNNVRRMRIQRKINTPFLNILRPLGTAFALRTSNDFNLAVAEVPYEELPKNPFSTIIL